MGCDWHAGLENMGRSADREGNAEIKGGKGE
jgi:hypothetical protein